MKKTAKFIGIDVSKNTLDLCVLSDVSTSYVIKNTSKDLKKFFDKHIADQTDVAVCFENTGKYSWNLIEISSDYQASFYQVNSLHMKRSFGLTRGKNDVIDAKRIANFLKKNIDELTPLVPERKVVKSLRLLLSERKFRVVERKKLLTKNKELTHTCDKSEVKALVQMNDQFVEYINKQIHLIEEKIQELISRDDVLNKISTQLESIPGVGKVLSWYLILKTNEFKSIDSPRKLACFAGVAPFASTSGTSVFGKSRVSVYADKTLKSLLHLSALSAIRGKNVLREYYQRKVDEGKNKMSVLNAVRNKIIHIVVAIIKNDEMYQNPLILS